MNERYAWSGGEEVMLRFGPETGPVAIVALPLFEEANRVRAFAVTLCRALAEHGVASVLPDVPGQGESLTPLGDTTVGRMRAAIAGVVDTLARANRRTYAIGIRSGALLDSFAPVRGRWHLAPVAGETALRDLIRIGVAAGSLVGKDGSPGALMDPGEPVDIGGNPISAALAADLQSAGLHHDTTVSRRTVRLVSDPAPADRKVEAAPLWRRAEPGNDPALAALLAEDIAQWIARCEA